MSRLITVAVLAVLLAAVGVASAVAAPRGSARLGNRKVCAARAYIDQHAGVTFIGTLLRHETFTVHRYSPSRRFAYGFAHGGCKKWGWIRTPELCG